MTGSVGIEAPGSRLPRLRVLPIVVLLMGLPACTSDSGSDTMSSTTTTVSTTALASSTTTAATTTTVASTTTSTTTSSLPARDVMELFEDAVVRLRDFGPLSVGATATQLQSDFGIILTAAECPPLFHLANGPSNVTIGIDQERITRIVIHQPTDNPDDPINSNPIVEVETLSGATFGSTEQEVTSIYGDQVVLEIVPEEFPFSGERRLTFVPRDTEDEHLRLIFSLEGGRVASMRLGETAAVDRAELCL